MLIIKIHGLKRYKNSGNKIRSNQNKKLYYMWQVPTKEEFENDLLNNYGQLLNYTIIKGNFTVNENSESVQ